MVSLFRYYYDEEISLYYLNARYYDPEIGRFISADSMDYLSPESINGLNAYIYCGNNPVMNMDPSGHIILSLMAVLGGVLVSAAISGVLAGFNSTDNESFGAAFLGGFVNGLFSGIGLAAGLAIAAIGGALPLIFGGALALMGGFIGGVLGSATTQAISYGTVNWNMAKLSGYISAGTNLMAFIGLSLSGIFSMESKFVNRFLENLKFDMIPTAISVYFGTLPTFNLNDFRGRN